MASTVEAQPRRENGTGDGSSKGRTGTSSRWRSLRQLAWGVGSTMVTIVLWDVVVRLSDVDPNLVPSPGAVWGALIEGARKDWDDTDGWYWNGYHTSVEALLGFTAGSLIGTALAVIVASLRFVRAAVMPLIVAFQALPKIAIAPLFVIWFGFGMSAKVWLTVTIVFFPVMVNGMAGFMSVDEDSRSMMRAFGASKLQTLRMLILPSALPYLFAGLETAMLLSLTAAVLGEFMGGNDGLGSYLLVKQSLVDIPAVFAALVVLGFLGLIMHWALQMVRKRVLHWCASTDSWAESGW